MLGNVLCTGKDVSDRTLVREMRVDPSGGLLLISHEHSKVHQGELFTGGHYQSAVASNSNIELLIKTGDDSAHLYIHNAVGGDSEFQMFEDTVVSSNGTLLSMYNNNRISPNVPLTQTFHTPTITSDGTSLNSSEFIPGGTGGVSPGAVESVGTEQLVLAPNTNYLLRLINRAGVGSTLNCRIAFYEVPVG